MAALSVKLGHDPRRTPSVLPIANDAGGLGAKLT